MKICVVGGNGNIGKYLCNHLIEDNHEVYCFNRGLSGNGNEKTQHIQGDRNNTFKFIEKIKQFNFDAAIDLTCYNKKQAKASIEAFKNVKHFIYCSSVSVYGRDFIKFPNDEQTPLNPLLDRNFNYALGKAEADLVFQEEFKENNFPVTILRPSITYGEKMGLLRQLGLDFSIFDRIKNKKPIIVSGDGNSFHQFMHSYDVGKIFSLLVGEKSLAGEIINVTSPLPTSWHIYHKYLMNAVGNEVEQVGVPRDILEELLEKKIINISDLFWQNSFFCTKKLESILPTFKIKFDLEVGINDVYNLIKNDSRILKPNKWEDKIIKKQKNIITNHWFYNF